MRLNPDNAQMCCCSDRCSFNYINRKMLRITQRNFSSQSQLGLNEDFQIIQSCSNNHNPYTAGKQLVKTVQLVTRLKK